jgi:hypothetical protein
LAYILEPTTPQFTQGCPWTETRCCRVVAFGGREYGLVMFGPAAPLGSPLLLGPSPLPPALSPSSTTDCWAGTRAGAVPIGAPGTRALFAPCPGERDDNALAGREDADGSDGRRGGCGADAGGEASGRGAGGTGPDPKGGTSLGTALPRGGVVPNALSSKRSRFRGPFVLSAISSMSGKALLCGNPIGSEGRNGPE